MRALLAAEPAALPQWFVDWSFVLDTSANTVWQMLSLALASPLTGTRHADGAPPARTMPRP